MSSSLPPPLPSSASTTTAAALLAAAPRSSASCGEMPVCPVTVKQTLMSAVHPLVAGPALVSPDITIGRDPPAKTIRSLPTLASRNRDHHHHQHQQHHHHQPKPDLRDTYGANEGPISPEIKILAPRNDLKAKLKNNNNVVGVLPPALPSISSSSGSSGIRLNKFVRRLHDMLQAEKDSGIVEWRRGLLVLHSTDAFAKTILPKYFNTRNFKTFRRQLNYYGFVHVRSFSTTGSTTTALWVNRDLAKHGSEEISSVLMLKRVEPCESAKTAEGRRVRKELAIFTVEEDIGVSPKSLQMEQIRSLAMRAGVDDIIPDPTLLPRPLQQACPATVPPEVLCQPPPPPPPAPLPATLPAPLFPRLSSKTRQVSPTSEENLIRGVPPQLKLDPPQGQGNRMEERKELAALPKAVPLPFKADPPQATTIAKVCQIEETDGDVGAANLLLMLSKSGRSASSPSEDVASAISPGQFLM